MVPDPGQTGAGQHSAHRPFHRAEDETGEHRSEHLISRCGETRPETSQQRRQTIGYTDRGGHWWNTPFIGGVVSTTNVPPHSMKCSAGAPRGWCSIQGAKYPLSLSVFSNPLSRTLESAKVEVKGGRFLKRGNDRGSRLS